LTDALVIEPGRLVVPILLLLVFTGDQDPYTCRDSQPYHDDKDGKYNPAETHASPPLSDANQPSTKDAFLLPYRDLLATAVYSLASLAHGGIPVKPVVVLSTS
jgi:hypothetical protein